MNKKYYFFSDVHLGLGSSEDEKLKEKKLVAFLNKITPDIEKLYIVGDLFDCWIEYRKVVPKGFYRLLSQLNEIAEAGIEINFLSGNHDFWLNNYLRDDVGLALRNDYMTEELDGKTFYITHGDGLSKGDPGYKIIKRMLRSRINQYLYSLVHPDLGVSLAQSSSKTSRHANEEDAYGARGMKEFAEKKVTEGFDYVVMGHYHKPQYIELNSGMRSGIYITLGDWIRHFTYGVYSDGQFELKVWKF